MHDTNRRAQRQTIVAMTGCSMLCACSGLLQFDKFSFEGVGGGTVSAAGGTSAAEPGSGGIGGGIGTAGAGGTTTGGRATGGAATGGHATGGKATGGSVAVSTATGGTATGGTATGGTATGGAATGGTATGGNTTGGTAMAGAGGVINTDPTRCPSPMEWHDLNYYATSADRSVPIAALAGGVAMVSEGGAVRCPAALIADNLLLTVDCSPTAKELFNFGSWRTNTVGYVPLQVSQCLANCPSDSGTRFNLHCACAPLDRAKYPQYPLVPWSRRRLRPAEHLSLIAFDEQGMAIAAKANAPSFDLFASPTGGATDPADVTLVFGEDSRLIGFCGRGTECGNLVGCTSIDSIINESHFELHWRYGVQNAFFADISGDGRADAVTAFPHAMVTNGQITSPDTGLLGAPKTWTIDSIGGDEETFLADLDGDGKSDLVSVSVAGRHLPNNTTIVALSTGLNFAAIAAYYGGDLKGLADLYWGNVDGNAGDELVTIGNGQVMVYRVSGVVLSDPESWGAYDNSIRPIGAAVADVTGDGWADVVIVRDTQLQVMPSTGYGFDPPSVWLDSVTPGAPGWFFAKLHNKDRADAILIDSNSSTVYLAGTNGFAKSSTPFAAIPIGERGNYFADVTGDGLDDAIVLNHQSAWVYPSTGSDFGVAVQWYDKPLYGGL